MSSRYVAALKDELNWIGTGLIVAGGFFAGRPEAIPFAWAAYEAAYMLFVPRSAWYERRLRRKADARVQTRLRRLSRTYLPALLEEDRDRFRELERLRGEIAEQQEVAETWVREILRKLDFLLERFLLFGSKRAEYMGYLRDLAEREEVALTDARGRPLLPGTRARVLGQAGAEALLGWLLASYDRRIAEGNDALAREADPQTREVLRKNLGVLARLRANVAQIGQVTRNLERQLGLVSDSFSLISGELRTRPPEQIISDVEEVVRSSRALSDALAETAALEQVILRHPQAGPRRSP